MCRQGIDRFCHCKEKTSVRAARHASRPSARGGAKGGEPRGAPNLQLGGEFALEILDRIQMARGPERCRCICRCVERVRRLSYWRPRVEYHWFHLSFSSELANPHDAFERVRFLLRYGSPAEM